MRTATERSALHLHLGLTYRAPRQCLRRRHTPARVRATHPHRHTHTHTRTVPVVTTTPQCHPGQGRARQCHAQRTTAAASPACAVCTASGWAPKPALLCPPRRVCTAPASKRSLGVAKWQLRWPGMLGRGRAAPPRPAEAVAWRHTALRPPRRVHRATRAARSGPR